MARGRSLVGFDPELLKKRDAMQTKENARLFVFNNNMPGCSGNDFTEFEQNVHQEISIRPGLWMSSINFTPQEKLQIRYKRQYPVINFGFILSADIKKNIKANPAGTKELNMKDGISGIQYARDQEGVIRINPGKKQQILHIHASIPFLEALLESDRSVLPEALKFILKHKTHHHLLKCNIMSPEIHSVVYQILNPSRSLSLSHLYLEGKILELLSLHLAALSMDHKKPDGVLLNPDEKQRIFTVEKCLFRDLNSPPTLNHLSAMAGLSANKLQAGFREIYGHSVFEYLREHKMQTARVLLQKSRANVSETAWNVGYVNVSHFSAAFKKRFGILPKQYLRESLKNHQSVSSLV